jgi:AraC family transcriptional regulator of adaptative response/methylated-DNA-[protein]-cysteine methyltransferase
MLMTNQQGSRVRRAGETSRDYQRIARAIGYLRAQAAAQPDLRAAARHVHMSEYHFQRLFTRWAGVSPKRFLQYLTVEQAKARIGHGRSLGEVAADVGLSGASRLHDLFVSIEAMSPGDFRAGAAGLEIRYGVHDSPFGPCVIAATDRGICALQFLDDGAEGASVVRREWPHANVICDPAATLDLARNIFGPILAGRGPVSLLVKGTNFQLNVWRALLEVPSGQLTTYSEIAKRIGHSRSQRAVGNAVAANPIAWLIPCHRVIRETGRFGHYRWGEARKAAMLGWEAARADAAIESTNSRSRQP